jgi:hypothetical protein
MASVKTLSIITKMAKRQNAAAATPPAAESE